MLRPNIRGVERRSLRFRAAGWHETKSGRIIQHRLPWRKSWIARISGDPNLAPMSSRSGSVFLTRQVTPEESEKLQKTSVRIRQGFAIAITTTLIFTIATLTLSQKTEPSLPAAAPLSAAAQSCEQVLAKPEKHVEAWLSGSRSSILKISELHRQQIGGVQSRVVEISCESKSTSIQVILTLRQNKWTLKKFARLEN